MSSGDTRALLPKSSDPLIKLLGSEVKKNGHPWQYSMVFQYYNDEKSKAEFEKPFPKPDETWDKLFTKNHGTGKKPGTFSEKTTRKQFTDAVFKEIVNILGGCHNALTLETMTSFDGDEIFLNIGITVDATARLLADSEELQLMLAPGAYTDAKVPVPTDDKVYKGEVATWVERQDEDGGIGDSVKNDYPVYLTYTRTREKLFQNVGELDKLRIVRRRLARFIRLEELKDAGIVNQLFPVHHWDQGVDLLNKKGWNNPANVCHWPSEARSDGVAAYFGPEIGFFFHWFNFLTRYLMVPAILSVITFALRLSKAIPRVELNYATMGFAGFLCLWSSVYIAKYDQAKSLKQIKWGMERVTTAMTLPRREFKDSYRDTMLDYFQHFFHWLAVVFCIVETMGVVTGCAWLQMDAAKDPDGQRWGFAKSDIGAYSTYVISLNIKLVDKVWNPLSAFLSRKENYRTAQELTDAVVTKMFIVKLFVFYYPFVYTVVIQPATRGCGPEHSHTDLTGCVDLLNVNLFVFFITQIVTEVGLIGVSLAMSAWAIRSEKQAKMKSHPDKAAEYTYLELQAKLPPYTEDDLVSDFLNAVITYGYIVLFGVSLPFICFLGFASNFVMKRLVAFKLSYAHQRPSPKAMDGIGAWESVVRTLSYLGVIANVYIALFTLKAFRDLPMKEKLFWFIVCENAGLAAKMGIEGLIHKKGTAQNRIEEHNADSMDQLLDEQDPTHIGPDKKDAVASPFK